MIERLPEGEGGRMFRALGASMAPAIREGDLVAVVPANALAVGDIVAFRSAGSFVCHRIVEIRKDGAVVTKGDNVRDRDPAMAAAEVLGKAVLVSRAPGWYVLRRLARRLGF